MVIIINKTNERINEAIKVLEESGAQICRNSLEAFAIAEVDNRIDIARKAGIVIPDNIEDYRSIIQDAIYQFMLDDEDAINYDKLDAIVENIITK